MKKIILSTISTLLLIVIASVLWLLTTLSGARSSMALLDGILPGELNITISDGYLLGNIEFYHLSYTTQNEAITIDHGRIHWDSSQLLHKQLLLNDVTVDDVSFIKLVQPEPDTEPTTIPEIVLPLSIDIKTLTAKNIQYSPDNAKTIHIIEQLFLSAHTKEKRVQINKIAVNMGAYEVLTKGFIDLIPYYPMNLDANWQRHDAELGELRGAGQLTGDLNRLELQHSISGVVDTQIKASLINPIEHPEWQASVHIEQFNSQKINKQWPEISFSGDLTSAGHLESFSLQLDGDWKASNYPSGKIDMNAQGDLNHLDIATLTLHTLEGLVESKGKLYWSPALAWDMTLKTTNINPGVVWSLWPGNIHSVVTTNGRLHEQKLSLEADILHIKGDLRGYPLTSKGHLKWDGAHLSVQQLKAAIGDTRLALNGTLGEEWDLVYSMKSKNLKTLLPELSGQLNIDGRLTGPRLTPHIVSNLSAKKLHYKDDYQIKSMRGLIDVTLTEKAKFTTAITVDDFRLKEQNWQQLSLHTDGVFERHQITLKLSSTESLIDLSFDSELDEHYNWRSLLKQLSIQSALYGNWSLKQSSAIRVEKTAIEVEPICLQQENSYMCFNLSKNGAPLTASLTAKAVSFHYLKPFLPAGITVNGLLDNASITMSFSGHHWTGESDIDLSSGDIRFQMDQEEQIIEFSPAKLQARLDETRLIAQINIPLKQTGLLDANLILPDWSPTNPLKSSQQLDANIQFDLNKIDFLTKFSPQVNNVHGIFNSRVHISGTLAQPQIEGGAEIKSASVEVSQFGILLDDIEFKARNINSEQLSYQARARSADGELNITGTTQLSAAKNWLTLIQIQGNDFELIDVPEALVLVSPDLNIKVDGKRISVTGDLDIPRARIRPKAKPPGAVSQSKDVFFVGEQEELVTKEEELDIHTNIRLTLGNRVNFDGFGLRGGLRGKLQLIDKPGELTLGRGELSIVDGVYQSYGQNLKIERGRLIYANRIIDDPGLDIRATRVTGEVTAGLQVSGTLKQPEVKLFSDPLMSEVNILSYIVLGRPIQDLSSSEGSQISTVATAIGLAGSEILARDMGAGLGLEEIRIESDQDLEQSALVLGRYLSPKLYVRYMTGIFDHSNVVQFRYDLTPKVQLQTETGTRTGADIFYTIER